MALSEGSWPNHYEILGHLGTGGMGEVYQPFPGPGRRVQVSNAGGENPVWAPNGRELFYQNGDGMMAVEVASSPTFRVGSPRLLFAGRFEDNFRFDISPDGQQFLVGQPVEPEQPTSQINVVLNWFEALNPRVPTGQ